MNFELNIIYNQECLQGLKLLPDEYVHCIVTSPPYFGLRDYGLPQTKWPAVTFSLFGVPVTVQEQECCLGLEKTPMEFVGHIVLIFREAKDKLRDDGTLWLNFGDSYNAGRNGGHAGGNNSGFQSVDERYLQRSGANVVGCKPKDLIGIPWMVAFALRDDGWYLRSDVIWHKPNPMPESVIDRPTKSHEHIFLLSKSQKYYYDHVAIMQDVKLSSVERLSQDIENQIGSDRVPGKTHGKTGEMMSIHGGRRSGNKERKDRPCAPENNGAHQKGSVPWEGMKANKRDVWTVTTKPFKEAHFATFPEDLIIDCIKAGSSEHGCCSKCGAAFERNFNKELVPGPKASYNSQVDEIDLAADKQDQGSNRMKDGHKPGWVNKTQTTGWTPTCDCNESIVPAIILDPFMGSGTTAIVARKLNRNFVGFELNLKYVKMANKRIHKELGMFV